MSLDADHQTVAAPRRSRRWKALMTAGGITLAAAMVIWAGPSAVWQQLRSIDTPNLVGAMTAIAIGTVLAAINSYCICGVSSVMGFGQYLRVFWIAWAMGLVFPGQVGDMLTLTNVLRSRGMALSRSIARTSVDKAVSLLCSLLVATQLFRLGDSAVLRSLSTAAALVIAGGALSAALALLFFRRAAGSKASNRWVAGAIATATEVAETVLARPFVLMTNLLLSFVKIGLTGLSYWLVLRGLTSVPADLRQVTIAAVSSGLVAYLPLSANGIGTVEFAATGLFGATGVGVASVLSMYVLLRAANFLLAWVPAAFLMPELLPHRKA